MSIDGTFIVKSKVRVKDLVQLISHLIGSKLFWTPTMSVKVELN